MSYISAISPMTYTFRSVKEQGQASLITRIFQDTIQPLYGDQSQAIRKIIEHKDRKTFILYENITPVGIVVFKTLTSNEFVSYDVRQSIEIKSLFVIDPKKNSRRGFGSRLLGKVQEEVQDIPHECLHVTVSEKKLDSLQFFQKHGFSICHTWVSRYLPDVKEWLLSRKEPSLASSVVKDPTKTRLSISKAPIALPAHSLTESSESRPLKRKLALDKEREAEPSTTPLSSITHLTTSSDPSSENPPPSAKRKHTDTLTLSDKPSPIVFHAPEPKDQKVLFCTGKPPPLGEKIHPSTSQHRNVHRIDFSLTLQRKYIDQIRSGAKTIEGRINSGVILKYRPGCTLRLFEGKNPQYGVVCNILAIRRYPSFRDMLAAEGVSACLPGVTSINEGAQIYDRIPGYAARARASGVVAIQVKVQEPLL